jgi:hypothetical protein
MGRQIVLPRQGEVEPETIRELHFPGRRNGITGE